LTSEFEVAVAAAKAAGEVLRSGFGQRQEVRYKGEVDLVTEADEKAEQKIKATLQEAFPAYEILTEESGRLPGQGDYRWIVDPLDGTTNYAHGLPLFSVSVALERAGEVVLGVVHDPMAQETYAAERGNGATLNGRLIKVSDTEELIQALLATGFPYERDDMSATLDLFGRFAVLTQSMRRLGSAALDMCYVGAGRLDGYYERGIQAWDIAAGLLLVKEAGGFVSDFRGSDRMLEQGQVLAANDQLHSKLHKLVAGALRRG
jgi:myo-inositol-1(or 4)-monophosphatase